MRKDSVEDVKKVVTDWGNVVIVVANELVKLEQNLFIFNQLWYMTKNCVKVVKKDVSDWENVDVVVVKWVG